MYLFRFPRMPHIIRFSHSVCLLFYAFTDQWRNVLYYKRVYDEGIVLVFFYISGLSRAYGRKIHL